MTTSCARPRPRSARRRVEVGVAIGAAERLEHQAVDVFMTSAP
jgi:hypothetical protein